MKKLVSLGLCAVLGITVIACAETVTKRVGGALLDAGRALTDVADDAAQAQSNPSEPPVPTPAPSVPPGSNGPAMVPPEFDASRLVGGLTPSANGDEWREVTVGPLVLTDLVRASSSENIAQELSTAEQSCDGATTPLVAIMTDQNNGLSGMRLFVPKGVVVCARGSGTAHWAGFRPYDGAAM